MINDLLRRTVHSPNQKKSKERAIARQLSVVEERMREACARARVAYRPVTVVGVTKKKPATLIPKAYQAGLRHFAENYWQEARSKFLTLGMGKWSQESRERVFQKVPYTLPFHWHFIGRLQKNKIKDIVRFFDFVQSVDTIDQLREINRRADRQIQVLIQVNIFDEPQKGGIKPAEVVEFIEKAQLFEKIVVVGLMTMGKADAGEALLRRKYEQMRRLFETLKTLQSDRCKMAYLSMGTSGDYPIAVASGANMVRLGTILFGRRKI